MHAQEANPDWETIHDAHLLYILLVNLSANQIVWWLGMNKEVTKPGKIERWACCYGVTFDSVFWHHVS